MNLRRQLFCLIGWMAGLCALSARAAIVIDLPDIVVHVPDAMTPVNGSFEVLLTLTDGDLTTPPQVGSYNLDFSSSGSGLTFNSVQSTTTATPLFPAPLAIGTITGLHIQVADDIVPGQIPAFSGAGLARVSYSVAAGNFGTYPLTFASVLTQLADGSGSTTYPLTLQSGSLTVALPEASSSKLAALVLLVAASLIAASKWRRRAPAC